MSTVRIKLESSPGPAGALKGTVISHRDGLELTTHLEPDEILQLMEYVVHLLVHTRLSPSEKPNHNPQGTH